MKETRTPRQFGLKDGTQRFVRDRPINRTFGPAGEALPEGGSEQQHAAREWLAHVQAGHFD